MLHKFSLGKDDQALSDALFRLVGDEDKTDSRAAVKEAEVSAHWDSYQLTFISLIFVIS